MVLAVWLVCADSAAAAQISISTRDGPPLVTIKGELDFADTIEFQRKTEGLSEAVILLASPGGNAMAGVQIGKVIRKKRFLTVVPSRINCASACALAWLGGTPRFMAKDSQIGFHAAYVMKGGRPRKSHVANEAIAAYLKQLALPRRAIAHITTMPPERLYWLSLDKARGLGIEAGVYAREGITSTLDKAPPGPASAMKRIAATDLLGADLPGMPIRTIGATECEARCMDDDDCAAFTFNHKHSACFHKAGVEFAVGYPWAVSGYRSRWEKRIRRIAMTIRDATDYPGNDIDRLKGTTLKACLLACNETSSCKAFTFVADNGECWLKNDIGSAEPSSGLVSGVK